MIIASCVIVTVAAAAGVLLVDRLLAGKQPPSGQMTSLQTTVSDPSGTRMFSDFEVEYSRLGVQSIAEWSLWRDSLRRHLIEDTFTLSDATAAPTFQTLGEREVDGIRRIDVGIPAFDGDTIPAVLLVPERVDMDQPAVLMIPGHTRDGESGLEQLVTDTDSYHQSGALELARSGFITLALELRGFGVRGRPRFPEHRIVAYNAILAGSFYKNLALNDIHNAFKTLQSFPGVDAERVAIAGVSLGGELAIEYGAINDAVRAIVVHSHGGRVGRFSPITSPGFGQPHYCHIIPGAAEVMKQEDPFLLALPRFLQVVRSKHQPFADSRFQSELESAWAAFNASGRLDVAIVEDGERYNGHAFFPGQAIEFLSRSL